MLCCPPLHYVSKLTTSTTYQCHSSTWPITLCLSSAPCNVRLPLNDFRLVSDPPDFWRLYACERLSYIFGDVGDYKFRDVVTIFCIVSGAKEIKCGYEDGDWRGGGAVDIKVWDIHISMYMCMCHMTPFTSCISPTDSYTMYVTCFPFTDTWWLLHGRHWLLLSGCCTMLVNNLFATPLFVACYTPPLKYLPMYYAPHLLVLNIIWHTIPVSYYLASIIRDLSSNANPP